VFSAYRRFYRAPKPAWRNYLRAVALEASWIARHQPLCIAYEDVVHNTPAVLRRLYAFLGVDEDFVPPVAITDRNDERWLHDQRFAAFMQHAFGVDAQRNPYSHNHFGAPRQPPVALHGGAVMWRGGAILLLGGRGTGTSQLVGALARAGARPIADGEVTLGGGGRVLVSSATAAAVPETVDVVLIVAAAYKEDAEWQPQELRGAPAVVPILNRAVKEGGSPRRLLRIAARLAAHVTTLAGPRPEADQVAPEILAYLDSILDRSSPEDTRAASPERPN